MADIVVNLKLGAANIRAQAQAAGEQVREAVQGKARKTGASPLEWIAQQNANKAAGGQWSGLKGGWLAPGSGGAGGGIGAGRAAAIGGAAGGIAGVVAQAIGSLIRMMAQAIKNAVVSAFREAASMYSKQLVSGGLTGGLIARRSLLAEVIGVGERDVWQYGKAVEYLNDKLRLSANEITKNVRTITAVTWSWRLMNINMRAFFSQIAAGLAPAAKQFADLTSAIIEFLRESGFASIGLYVWRTALHALNVAIVAVAAATESLINFFITLKDAMQWVLTGGKSDFSKSNAGWAAIGKLLESLSRASSTSKVPEASVSYNRLQASPWERMGLVIGAGGGSNPLRATERNTRMTVAVLKEIKAAVLGRTGSPPRLAAVGVNKP